MNARRKDVKGWTHISLLFAVAVFLAGCGAGKTLVMKPVEPGMKFSTVEVTEGNSTVNVAEAVRQSFKLELERLLFEPEEEAPAAFKSGSDLKLTYRFLQLDPGNRFSRWFLGGIGNAGEGTITIEVQYSDAAGRELAKIQSEGKIGSGFFGGGFTLATRKAAQEVAEYTKQNFK